ncbi:MAG: transcription-repair coupling factor, partial [Gammaproteobacteria bacterium]
MAHPTTSIFSPEIPKSKDQTVFWTGLKGCADALALASAIKNEDRLFVIVTPDNHTALRLEHELEFFLQGGDQALLHFPDWETLPYDVFSPLPEIISERLKTLALLPQVKRGALIVSVSTLMHRLAPREHVLAHSFAIQTGDLFNLELNRIKLESVGYHCVSQVYQHAEFAVRGSIVDLFPMGSKMPFRIELFDEEVESIRTFDPETQRSLEKIDRIELFPAREFPFTDAAIKQFRQSFREHFPDASQKNTLYIDVSKGIAPGGIEYYLPLFVERTATLFDYLPASSVLVLPNTFAANARAFYGEAEERYQQRKYNVDRPLLEPGLLFLTDEVLHRKTESFARIDLGDQSSPTEEKQAGAKICPFNCHALPNLTIDAKLKEPAAALQQFANDFEGRILFVAESAGRREDLIDKLRQYRISVKQVDNWPAFLKSEETPCMVVAPM